MTSDIDKKRFHFFRFRELSLCEITRDKFGSHDVDNSLHINFSKIEVDFDVLINIGVVVVNKRNSSIERVFFTTSSVLRNH
jgi:hypothetical protein